MYSCTVISSQYAVDRAQHLHVHPVFECACTCTASQSESATMAFLVVFYALDILTMSVSHKIFPQGTMYIHVHVLSSSLYILDGCVLGWLTNHMCSIIETQQWTMQCISLI